MKKITLSICSIIVLCISTHAQLSQKPVLTLKAAERIMDSAMAYAKKVNAPGGAIAIVDDGGHILLMARSENTFANAAEVSIAKATSAALFKKDTKAFEDNINTKRPALITVGYNMLEGGVPIIYNGFVIGAIGVSGTASADQDVEVANAGAKINLNN